MMELQSLSGKLTSIFLIILKISVYKLHYNNNRNFFFDISIKKVQGIIISKEKEKKLSILTISKCFLNKMQNLHG